MTTLPWPILGALPGPDGTRFSLFATTAQTCEVRLFDDAGRPIGAHPMTNQGNGLFEATVPGVGHGSRYKFALDGREFPDPYARFLPDGVHGPAMVYEPRHQWRHGEGIRRSLRDLSIYELHVGTFTEAGTYAGARERLPDLVELGITAIEIMPVAAFAGSRGWGYDGVALYAPFAPYGTPDDLRALVDEAHRLGLTVLLDVVYNHFGPAGNYLAAYSPLYFTNEIRNAWGDAPNFGHPAMRQLVLENARMWLRDFRFDGLRLDAVHAIVDPSPHHILHELSDEARKIAPHKLLIAEDERNDPADVNDLGLHGIWADDFHHQVRVTLTAERDGYYGAYQPGAAGIAEAIRQGWLYRGQPYPVHGRPRGRDAGDLPAEAFVYCIQNHDQIGNRALGDRLNASVPLPAYLAASTLLLFLPMTPLLFQGQEWASGSPFQFFTDHDQELGPLVSKGRREEFRHFRAFSDPAALAQIPDPQALETFTRSRLLWEERTQGDHARVLDLYQRLLRLRREDPVLANAGREGLDARAEGQVLLVRRWSTSGERLLVVNFAEGSAPLPESAQGRPLLLSTIDAGELRDSLPGFAAFVLGDRR
jgi:maltooligosyltrehalose trehalohydrolase